MPATPTSPEPPTHITQPEVQATPKLPTKAAPKSLKRRKQTEDQDSDSDGKACMDQDTATTACKPLTGAARKRRYETPLDAETVVSLRTLEAEARKFGLDVDTHQLNADLIDTLQTPHFDKRIAIEEMRALIALLDTSTKCDQGHEECLIVELQDTLNTPGFDKRTAIDQLRALLSMLETGLPERNPEDAAEVLVLRPLVETLQHNAKLTKTVLKLSVDAIRAHTDEIKSAIEAISNAETIPDLEDIEDVRQHNEKIRLALQDMLV